MSGEQFSLVWNSFPRNLSSGLYTLLTDEHLVDVTLAAEGQILRAHKLILSVCSTYFRELFKGNSCKHPIVILKDVNYRDLSAMLHFMYQGEVNIKQEDLASFLRVAETLQIKGLTKDKDEKGDSVIDDTLKLQDKLAEETEELSRFLQTESHEEEATELEKSPEVSEKSPRPPEKPPRLAESSEVTCPIKDPTDCTEFDPGYNHTSNQPASDSEAESVIRTIRTIFTSSCENAEQIPSPREEPLDYTSDVGRISRAKNEPLDYTSDIDIDVGYKNYTTQEKTMDDQQETSQRQDFVPSAQLIPYNQGSQDDSLAAFNHLEAAFRNDFSYDNASFSRGRRTVKGIPSSSLPLETTLRVVSELGPTLRMERGKVIRMYSCPWCLRHFTRKENLKLHVRYIHGPLESLTCKLCGNKYKNSNSLRVHSYLYHNAKRNKHSKPSLVNGSM